MAFARSRIILGNGPAIRDSAHITAVPPFVPLLLGSLAPPPDHIADVLEQKRKIFNDLLSMSDKPAQLGLSEEEIFGLFDIAARPKRAA